ncbi:RNA polymerase subunit sigma-70 [Pandoraea pnomenusa]|jgi:RNA polymerase sigma factor for flagellar operon FliA|uniref:RNA polymerase sigma factor FliA n=4 Tax=Pandoraea TaxID=93217 RepID=A0A378YN68_9BURK|nr:MULTISPECIES: RNA polymerase sigma factor FliA [Pandoraea]AHB08039.1 RNA polymerase sigma70 [Pandoraea pnomenusa 3kgm]AHB75764.1 RNA polymerase sigma factor FliA [Pandoraea pnomenusa]AHN75917.1 RNA polymerase sigma factor FliA [Pandoraea pnomenusa]AIU27496.1 RNA polymerase subunit sigma-70 [Pandoraea pnomenusa]ANC44638.1 RNA polymerase sigma factor FliA [Pandoraea pnomenusa]
MYTARGKVDTNDTLTQYAPLVRRLALQLMAKLPASVELEDLIQAGMLGLLDAANRYQETQGAQFETYASQRIRGAMLDELRELDWASRGIRKTARQIEQAVQRLEQRLGRGPSESEIAGEMSIGLSEYQQMLQDVHGCQLIYYEDFESADEEPFIDRICSDPGADPLTMLLDEGLRGGVVDAIDRLPDREKLLMSLYYEQGLNLREIGAVLEVSESRVCQLHSQAISRLRATLREKAWTSAS